jgi:hypothetical protein
MTPNQKTRTPDYEDVGRLLIGYFAVVVAGILLVSLVRPR